MIEFIDVREAAGRIVEFGHGVANLGWCNLDEGFEVIRVASADQLAVGIDIALAATPARGGGEAQSDAEHESTNTHPHIMPYRVPNTLLTSMTAPTNTPRQQLRILSLGLTMACAVCGQRGLFRRWVVMTADCPRCELHFERHDGHFVGAVGINTALSFTIGLTGLVAFFIATYPDIPTGPPVFLIGFGAAAVPLLLYPVSKTLWTAIDLVMRPLEEGEALPPETWADKVQGSCEAGGGT